MQSEIPTELPDAILVAAGQAWVTCRHQWRTCGAQFMIEDDSEGHHWGSFVRMIWQTCGELSKAPRRWFPGWRANFLLATPASPVMPSLCHGSSHHGRYSGTIASPVAAAR